MSALHTLNDWLVSLKKMNSDKTCADLLLLSTLCEKSKISFPLIMLGIESIFLIDFFNLRCMTGSDQLVRSK